MHSGTRLRENTQLVAKLSFRYIVSLLKPPHHLPSAKCLLRLESSRYRVYIPISCICIYVIQLKAGTGCATNTKCFILFDSFVHFVFIIYHFQQSHDSHSITTIQEIHKKQHCIHSFKFTHSPYHCVSILSVYSLSILSTRYHHQPHTYRSNQIKIQKKKNKKNPNWIKKNEIETKSKKNTKKSNKLRSNQAVFMVGVSRYLIAVDSWLRSRHHHRYLCRRPLNSAAHHCHHHCTYLHKHLYNASALALLSLSRSLSL